MRSDVDVVIRIGSVILDPPADVDEPERKFGLRRQRAVNEMMIRIDADDAAPRAFSNERAELVELKAVAENVAVRSGKLIRQRDDRAGDRLGRIWNRAPYRGVSYPTRLRANFSKSSGDT